MVNLIKLRQWAPPKYFMLFMRPTLPSKLITLDFVVLVALLSVIK